MLRWLSREKRVADLSGVHRMGEGCMREKLLLVACVQLCLSSVTRGENGAVHWGVRVEDVPFPERRAREIAQERGLEFVGRVEPFEDVFELKLSRDVILARSVENVVGVQSMDDGVQSVDDAVHNELSGHPDIKWASKQIALKRVKREFSDPAFSRQWHLVNRLEMGHDTNVSGVWEEGVNGAGVTVAVVDDGVERLNPDIVDNFNAVGSHDFNDEDEDPSPNLKAKYDNSHGTKCAGLIAAGTNHVCGVGVAYGAKVSGIRMLDGTVTDILEGKSFVYKAHVNWIYSCSWGPEDDGKTVEGPGHVAREAMKLAIQKGRYGYGNVFVFASGNGGVNDDNCNFDGYANSIYTITIGAVDELNNMPYYAELCSAMLAVTYSNGHSHGDRMVVTTDSSSHSGCTYRFSGTSASAPIASGMIALMLETRNCLTWRDVQHVIVYTAVMVDAGHAQWAENAAGFHHSNQHGFGLLDAYRMTRVAGLWPLVPPSVKRSYGPVSVSQLILPSQSAVFTRNVTTNDLPDSLLTLEHVTVTLSLSHSHRGRLAIFLLSPHGTNSTLATPRSQDRSGEGLRSWTFSTVRFWAETPVGQWKLVVSQTSSHDDRGTVNSWTLTLYGSAISKEEVSQRQSLVEDAVATPTWTPLACPALPSNPEELHLTEPDPTSFPLWKQLLLIIGCVLVLLLVVHCVAECVCERVKAHRRISALPPVTYSRLDTRLGGDKVESATILATPNSGGAMLPLDTTSQGCRLINHAPSINTHDPNPDSEQPSWQEGGSEREAAEEEEDTIREVTSEQQPLLS